MVAVYIGLGSNLAHPQQQIIAATTALNNIVNTRLVKVSSLYASKPMGPQNQPDYINAVALIETELSPLALLDELQRIENEAGRVRIQRWGARTLDLDMLLYANQQIQSDRLTVPHYGIQERAFVLLPLAEISPQLTLPNGESVMQLAAQIEQSDISKL